MKKILPKNKIDFNTKIKSMKNLIYVTVFMFLSVMINAQVVNGDFENWSFNSDGLELPDSWEFNINNISTVTYGFNYIIKEGSSTSNLAVKLKSNLSAYDAPINPAISQTIPFINSNLTLHFDYKLDSLSNGNNGAKVIFQQYNGSEFVDLSVWESSAQNFDNFVSIDIPITNITDSLKITFATNQIGWLPFSSVIFDNVSISTFTSIKDNYHNIKLIKINDGTYEIVNVASTVKYNLFNINGELIKTGKSVNNQFEINNEGLNILQIELDGKFYNFKIW